MNERFFSLPAEKQQAIINAGYRVFSQNSFDIPMMYREMYWASEGYLWEMVQRGNVDMERMEKGFTSLMNFWKSVYLRKG